MTQSRDQLLSEFIDRWNSGRFPDVDTFLDRARPGERAELAADISAWLALAPTPDQHVSAAAPKWMEDALASWPAAVGSARARSGLGLRELARQILSRSGLQGTKEEEARAAAYLDHLERGELDPQGVSQKVIDAVAAVLSVPGEKLGRTTLRPAVASARFRKYSDEGQAEVAERLNVLADAMLGTTRRTEEMDAVDQLFVGGRHPRD